MFFGPCHPQAARGAGNHGSRAHVVNASTGRVCADPDPRDVPLDFTPGLAPATAADTIARQVRRLNAHDAALKVATENGRWFREFGPRKNAHGLYAPGDAR
jgi:hypothetical protein